ncbi:MAG: sensor histidine kinase, partial [Flavobacteriales bacterium]
KRNLVEKEKAEKELKELNDRLSDLTRHLQNVRDEEKKKIAMEIHDQLGQELTGNKLGLYWIQQQIKQHGIAKVNEEEVQEKINYLLDLNTQTINTVRRIAHELRPVVLDDIGLLPALEWHVDNFNKNETCKCDLILETENLIFDKELSTAIYRIAQEALTNINRHAQASKASLALYTDQEFLHLEIKDNGVGAIKDEAMKSRSMGLFGMRERLKAWDGDWDLQTAPNQGTKICIKIKLKKLN